MDRKLYDEVLAVLNIADETERRRHQHRLPLEQYSLSEHEYYFTICARQHGTPFTNPVLAQQVIDALLWYRDHYQWRLFCYCLMPDHLHFINQMTEDSTLTYNAGAPITGGGLDYPVAVLNLEQYEMIGLKTLNGPWPKAVYYEPTETLGNIYLWPNPSQGQMHIFVDQIFSRFTTMFDNINLPQGYNMALRWCLAERLMPMYGKASPTQIQMIMKFAAQGKSTVKRTNMNPAITSTYADALLVGRQKDAGWILSGGFFR